MKLYLLLVGHGGWLIRAADRDDALRIAAAGEPGEAYVLDQQDRDRLVEVPADGDAAVLYGGVCGSCWPTDALPLGGRLTGRSAAPAAHS